MPPKFYKKKTTSYLTHSASLGEHSNAIYLIIVESPSKCAKIENYLGSDYKCIASKGHIRTIDGIKNIDSKNNYSIKFSIIEEKKDHIAFMKNIISSFPKKNIILATDDDREGEGIAWHICDLFDLPIETTKRILFHEITQPALLKAIQSPLLLNMDLVRAQHTRQVLDILVGYKVSPFLWKHIYNNKNNGLSAGRCQTPALRLVYENDQLISANEIETKYKTTGTFFGKNIDFQLNTDFVHSYEVNEFLEESKSFSHIVSISNPKESIQSPPKPFNTSALLQHANNVLHMSPKETMHICQQLYQAGHITYMRTENTKYSADFLSKVHSFILQKWEKENYIGDFANIVNKDEINPHEAIRVTHIEYSFIVGLEGKQHSLYKLIWRNTIQSCMSPAKYNCTTISISAPKKACYTHVVKVPLFLGWKITEEKEAPDNMVDQQNSGKGLLFFFQSLQLQIPVPYNKIESVVCISHKHSHYSESSLIQKLEHLGIGRPSTFAMIVDTIQERGYVKKQNVEGTTIDCVEYVLREHTVEETKTPKVFGQEKNKLVLQPIGLAAVEFLIEHFQPLFDYEYTKQMEEDLERLSNNEWQSICAKCENLIQSLAKPVSKLAKPVYLVSSRDGTLQYQLCFHQYGTSLKTINHEGEPEYKKVNPKIKIDIEMAKSGKYIAEDLLEIEKDHLGKYLDEDVCLKNGKYGPYIQCGAKTISTKSLGKPIEKITLEDALLLLNPHSEICIDGSAHRAPPAPKNPNLLKILNSDLSIRKGKYGPYIYYMPSHAKKPEFFPLGKMRTKYENMDIDDLIKWIGENYNICVTYKDK